MTMVKSSKNEEKIRKCQGIEKEKGDNGVVESDTSNTCNTASDELSFVE